MYQTLQQRLKKFQGFVEKWPNSSTSVPMMDRPVEQLDQQGSSHQTVEASPEAIPVTPSLDLMDQFKSLKELWLEGQQSIETATLPKYGQALNTEIHKQFRLMEVDITFLKAARQAKTVAQRKQQLNGRLQQLMDYCETGIKLSQ